jgi:hypothetical protein
MTPTEIEAEAIQSLR